VTDPHSPGRRGPAPEDHAMNPNPVPADPTEGPPQPGLWEGVRKVLKPVASLQLTVVLFVLSLLLVFFGTLAQMNNGIWTVVERYFWSYWVKVDAQLLVQFAQKFDVFGFVSPSAQTTLWFPWIGGKLLAFLLVINLLAAHIVRFKFTTKRAGVLVLHAGLLLLFAGEYITREFSIEQRMTIDEGQTANYAEDIRNPELALVDRSDPKEDRVVVVPGRLLEKGGRVTDPDLPVDVQVDRYFKNSLLSPVKPGEENPATAGLGLQARADDRGEVSGVDTNQTADFPAAYVTFYKKGTDERLGTYLVSVFATLTGRTQEFTADGKAYDLSLRFTRHYKPYTLTLKKFRFDRYVGTNTPKNYSSEVILSDPENGITETHTISMNDPLRYRGETFYQSSFDERTEKTTILQVVRNPGWRLPYLACVVVAIGMLMHFGAGLRSFLGRRSLQLGREAVAPATAFERVLPWGVAGVAVLILSYAALSTIPAGGKMNLAAAGRLPVVDGGRVKPLDTVARVDLRLVSNREEFSVGAESRMRPAIEWFFDAAAAPTTSRETGRSGVAADDVVFRVENDDLRQFLGLPERRGDRYSFNEVSPKLSAKEEAVAKAEARPPGQRDPLEAALIGLHRQLDAFEKIGPAGLYEVVRIENDQVRQLLGLPYRDGLRYSFAEIGQKAGEFDRAAEKAEAKPPKQRDLFDVKLLELQKQLNTFMSICARRAPLVISPVGERDWRSAEDVRKDVNRHVFAILMREFPDLRDPHQLNAQQRKRAEQLIEQARAEAEAGEPAYAMWDKILAAYRKGDATTFNNLVAQYRETQYANLSSHDAFRVELESFLNRFAPFYYITGLYFIAFLLGIAGWVGMVLKPSLGESLRRGAFYSLVVVFVVHTVAMFARMYLMGRPLVFVTNLYSSAVFIGCIGVGICLLIERVSRIGLGNAVAGVTGFWTCILAHNLSAGGDTLEMMQAVLDTNFWLATHVTTIVTGYAATYVAGAIGIAYIVLGIGTPLLDRPVPFGNRSVTVGRLVGMVMYGTICAATLLSFVGTVLGGIWADQSWGRFWGWDPKENGAVMIVLWNALILHARWAGLVKDRGVAVLTLGGNIITTWSYFGTNQLGIGLHAYGFNNALAAGCAITWAVHLALIVSGLAPKAYWTSGVRTPPVADAASAAEPVAAPAAPAAAVTVPPAPANGHANGQTNGHPPGKKWKKSGKRR
jgi:ABC-type transport system involved in cytochrome c biogenesis permease subunit